MISPQVGGASEASGTIRTRPEDFFVDEVLGFEPDGVGEHLFLQIEKIGANTAWVASRLAEIAGVSPRNVSYAGRKDRHAVARQWFSIWLPGRVDPDFVNGDIEGVKILRSVRNSRKLRRGALTGNRFVIVVRDMTGAQADLEERLLRVQRHGVPNFFGPQRFGRNGSNLDLARRWFKGELRLKGNRKSLALSAARSALFNAVLKRRLLDGTWLRCLPGDALNPEGRGGFFVCDEPDEVILRRIDAGELHVTGPMWGSGELPVHDEVAALESAVAAEHQDLAAGLAAARLDQERRPLRVMPDGMGWQWSDDTITLSFGLPKGAFATSLLAELMCVKDRVRDGADA